MRDEGGGRREMRAGREETNNLYLVVGDSDKVEVYMMERQYVNILYELNPELAGKWFKYLASALQRALYTREKQLYFNDH